MKDRLTDALRASHADYTEIRLERTWTSHVAFRGRRLETATASEDQGGFVRALHHGCGWGIAAFTSLDQLPAMVARAGELSRAVRLDRPIRLGAVPPQVADVPLDLDGDVRGIPLSEKKRLIEAYNGAMLAVDGRVVDTNASYHDEVSEYWYINSEGTLLHEVRPEVTLSGTAVARRNGVIEKGLESIGLRRGWRSVQDAAPGFQDAARRAVALLDAPGVAGGTYPVVLDPELAGVFIHEAFGHLSEADFVYENPQAREMMTLGRRFGKPVLNAGDNGAAPGLRGTLPYDDEGTPTRDTPLIREGILVGRLHSRETAAAMNEQPTGNARAMSFRHPPIVRMTNTYIGNGKGTFEDLIGDIKLGVYACSAFGGQTMLENFSFTAAHGYMIRDGKVAELVKDVVIAGNLFQTLDRIDRIAGDFRWNQMGGGCGKGGQFPLAVTEGAPHVRIEEALVGGDVPRTGVIPELLDLVRRSAGAEGADCLWRRAERTTVSFESGRLKAAGVTEEAGVNLRIVSGGRVGVAGSTAMDATPAALVDRAVAAAGLGEPVALAFPTRAALPSIPTSRERAANAPLDALIAIGRELVERLAREGCQVNVTVEREIASTRVANLAGAEGEYQATGVAISAEVWRISGNDVLAIGDGYEGADLPTAEDVTALVRSVQSRLEPALKIVDSPGGSLPVVFTPAGVSALVLPVTQALSGKAVLQGISPLAGKIGEQVFDSAFTLTDDPLTPGRPASRPIDDECVPSRTTAFVERGVVKGFMYDLETAARAGGGAASTGHGQRGIFSKPVPGFTNIIFGNGGRGKGDGALGGELIADIKEGLLVDDLIGVGQGNVIGGAFSHPVALAYRIERGEITGRVKDAAVAGNSYELLKRIGGFGNDRRWYGGRSTPSLLLEGVSVAGR